MSLEELASPSPPPRFDWRHRAPSQVKSKTVSTKLTKRIPSQHLPLQPGEPYHDAATAYAKHFLPLIEAEQEQEESTFTERLASWSLPRLKEEGYCLTGMSAYWLERKATGDRPVACFSLGAGIVLPEHRLMNGTEVRLSRFDPLSSNDRAIRGSVVSNAPSHIDVAFLEEHDEIEQGEWRMDLGYSSLVFERMREAVRSLHHDPQTQMTLDGEDGEMILSGTGLRDILLESFGEVKEERKEGMFDDDQFIQSWAKRYSRPNPVVVEGDPPLNGLNPAQIRAMAMMIGERASLIQGPPGTGKTRTIIETIKLLKAHFQTPIPLLVCTYTNAAVDNLVEGFARAGLKPLRVAFGGKVRPSLLEHTWEYRIQSHPSYPKKEQMEKKRDKVCDQIQALSQRLNEVRKDEAKYAKLNIQAMERDLVRLERRRDVLKGRLYRLRTMMQKDVIEWSDVVCTTCITAASSGLRVKDFPVVFLDEASMSTEPASLIPLMKGCQHVSLIGDHKQLPPVIVSPEAQSCGFAISLFERLISSSVTIPSIMLDIQYRMHPSISFFPSLEFYDQSLQDGTVDHEGSISSRLRPPTSQHLNGASVIFLDHSGNESVKDRSRVNHNEAHIVASVVEDLLLHNSDLQGSDIGVIAPYAAQISLLNRTLAKYSQERFKQVLGDHRAMQIGSIEVKTVDGFEGREKEIIVFSTVRNNSSGFIGFLADKRRLNVGLTRAKRGLFIVGSLNTLRSARRGREEVGEEGKEGRESWKRYAEYLKRQGLVISLDLASGRLEKALYGNMRQLGLMPKGGESRRTVWMH